LSFLFNHYFIKMNKKTTLYPVQELIQKRYSPKAYDDKAITSEILNSIFEAARWAPSSHNRQPWKFLYAHKSETGKFNRMVDALNESNIVWAKNAAVLVLAMAEDMENNSKAAFDLGTAVAFMNMQALSHNIYMRHMGGFNKDVMKDHFAIPNELTPFVVLAFGYKGNADMLNEELKSRELAPQSRKDFDQLFF